MRNLKKFLALVLAMIMVAGATAVVSAADFEDVAADNVYAAAIDDLSDKGIVVGTGETTFTPDADVQRYQMALLVARATTGKVDNAVWTNGIVPFTDVTEYKGAISYAYVNKIIKGRTETTFDPNGNIAYVDALTMVVRALGYTDLEYPWGFYNKAVELGLTANIAIDDLYTTLDRAETAEVIYQMIYAKRADSNITFAAEYFDTLDVVRTSDLFVITATPAQSYFGETTADVEEGKTLVAVQPLVNGVPAGDVAYIPVEDLGIEAADVEKYLNYAVELVDYDAAKGTYYDAILGAAPEKVYTADVKFDKDAATNNKLTIADKTYTLADDTTGRNALVAFAGTGVASSTDKVLTFLEDGVSIFFEGNVVAKYAGKINGVVHYEAATAIDGKTLITADKALELWGTYATGTENLNYASIKAADIQALDAFELQLFDDNNDGKFDRAIANKVYISAMPATYKAEVDAEKSGEEVCDKLVNLLTGANVESEDVTYTEAVEVGTVFTFTFNAVTNTVNVIDTVDYQTGKITKYSTTDGRVLTIKTEDGTVELAADKFATADLGALAVTYGTYTDEAFQKGEAFKVFGTADWDAFFKFAALGKEFNFYAVDGNLVLATEVPEEEVTEPTAKTEFVILDAVADYDFGAMDLNVFADGEEKVVALNKYVGKTLADMTNWEYGLFIADAKKFFKAQIFAVNNTADGINVIETVDYTANYVKGEDTLLTHLDITSAQVDAGVIEFTNGTVMTDDYTQRIRTTDETVIYVITHGANEDQSDAKIEAYIGSAEDATITLTDKTHILVDKIGYKANQPTQDAAKLIIIVDGEFKSENTVERDTEVTVLFTGDGSKYNATDAESLGLTGYGEDAAFLVYADAAINFKTGEAVTVYSTTELTAGVYELDENGVVNGDGMTLDAAVAAGLIADWSDVKVAIDYFVGDKYYNVKLDGAVLGTEGKITTITLTNIGAELKLDHNGGTDNLVYAANSSTSAWNNVVNFFGYIAQMENVEVYAVKISDAEYRLYVSATEK